MDFARFRVTTFAAVREEIMPMIQGHLLDTMPDLEPNMDFAYYDMAEEHGEYLSLVAKHHQTDAIIGYNSWWISEQIPHYKHLSGAYLDAFYIKKEYRKGWNYLQFLRFAETQLKLRDIDVAYFFHPNMDKLLERAGYAPMEKVHWRRLS